MGLSILEEKNSYYQCQFITACASLSTKWVRSSSPPGISEFIYLRIDMTWWLWNWTFVSYMWCYYNKISNKIKKCFNYTLIIGYIKVQSIFWVKKTVCNQLYKYRIMSATFISHFSTFFVTKLWFDVIKIKMRQTLVLQLCLYFFSWCENHVRNGKNFNSWV